MQGRELLERLVATAGTSGSEGAVGEVVRAAWEPLCAGGVTVDALGNVAALLPADADPPGGTGPGSATTAPRLMITAHLDEIGLLVTAIEAGGFLRVSSIGGFDRRYLPGLAVIVHGRRDLPGLVGTLPPHLTSPEARGKPLPMDEAFVDVGLTEAGVRDLVRVGDRITPDRRLTPLAGETLCGKALDDRASLAALHEALLHLLRRRRAVDVLLVATVQEEVGLRGAATSAFGAAPDLAVAVDVGHAVGPGLGEDEAGGRLGGGPCIAQGANFHPAITAALLAAAEAEGVPHQREFIPGASGTDAWAIQVARAGVPCGLLSLPLRYMHSPVEMVDARDVRETGRLLAAFAARVDADLLGGLVRVLK